ncbi:MAG: protein kinase [Candidatus Brocadiaceae bacterium]|nr:protein kinase [Candidatus Brocadiaceae bacterium]
MYNINNYQFLDFKIAPNLHKSNYAVLINTIGKGIKYAPYADFALEYNILKELDHAQIPKVYDIGQGDLFKNGKLLIKQNFIVLQHIDGYDLVTYFNEQDMRSAETINEVVHLFITACEPLQYLHDKHYIHCDLKPGHLIYHKKSGITHIIDFELAIENGDFPKGISKEYASPEQLQLLAFLKNHPDVEDHKDIPVPLRLDGRTDLYAIGLLLYQIITKKLWRPEKVLPGKINKSIPQKLEEITLGLLEENISKRISSAMELKKSLSSM